MVISMNKEQCRLIQWAAFHCYNHLPDSDSDIGSRSRVIFSAGGSEAEHGSMEIPRADARATDHQVLTWMICKNINWLSGDRTMRVTVRGLSEALGINRQKVHRSLARLERYAFLQNLTSKDQLQSRYRIYRLPIHAGHVARVSPAPD